MMTLLAAAHNCNGSGLCQSGNAALGGAVLIIIIYALIGRKKK
jgi:hypothetical protein